MYSRNLYLSLMKDGSYAYMRYILWEWKNIIYIIEFGFFGQNGPLMLIITLMYFPVCWKFLLIYLTTNNISPKAVLVKMLNKENNQPVTNNLFINLFINLFRNLVETSETIREVLNNKYLEQNQDKILNFQDKITIKNNEIKVSNDKFNQWLAGLIDGDGYFSISQNKYTSCEITLELRDEKTLKQIQNKFGGSIKLRAGVKAIRYRLHNKEGIIKLVNAVNGNIRNTKRLVQFNKVCNLLNISFINPIILTNNNAWFSGFFDADGTINYSFKNNVPQLTISVTNKYLQDVQEYKNILGGNIYFDKSQNGYYKWSIQSKDIVLNFINDYIKINPSRTLKINKLYLSKEFYNLKELKDYNKYSYSIQYKAWLNFENKWKNK